MTYIVHGATGAQGTPVASLLSAAGHHVTAAVRTPSTYAGPGTAVAVDLSDTASLVEAYTGAEGVFVHLPIGSPDQQVAYARTIADAVDAARPGRVVLSTSGYTLDDPASAVSILAERLTASGVSSAVVQPRLYLENLLLPVVVGPVQQDGVLGYPVREDYAVSWSSHLDVADVVLRLLEDRAITGIVGVGALPGLLGSDLAQGFAEHLGRPVRFEAITPDAFEQLITPLFGPAASSVVDSYRWRATQPHELVDEETSAQRRLGITPRTVAQWLGDIGV